MFATVMFADGTPMLLGGDEFGRSQARQQQSLLPGQRDFMVELGACRKGRKWRIAAVRRKLVEIRKQQTAHQAGATFYTAEESRRRASLKLPGLMQMGRAYRMKRGKIPSSALLCIRRATKSDARSVALHTLLLNPTAKTIFRLPQPELPSQVADGHCPAHRSECRHQGKSNRGQCAQCRSGVFELGERAFMIRTDWHMSFGANLTGPDRTEFRIWAPAQQTLSLAVEGFFSTADGQA